MLHRIGSAISPTIKSQSGIDQDLTAPLAPLFYCAAVLNVVLNCSSHISKVEEKLKMERKAVRSPWGEMFGSTPSVAVTFFSLLAGVLILALPSWPASCGSHLPVHFLCDLSKLGRGYCIYSSTFPPPQFIQHRPDSCTRARSYTRARRELHVMSAKRASSVVLV